MERNVTCWDLIGLKTSRGKLWPGQPGDLLLQHLLVGLQLLDLGFVLLPQVPDLLTGVPFPEVPEVHWHLHTCLLGWAGLGVY